MKLSQLPHHASRRGTEAVLLSSSSQSEGLSLPRPDFATRDCVLTAPAKEHMTMGLALASVLLALVAMLAVIMLREAAIHGLGLPGQEQREWEDMARARAAAKRARGEPFTGSALRAAGRTAGVGIAGGVLAGLLGTGVGIVAVLGVIAWLA